MVEPCEQSCRLRDHTGLAGLTVLGEGEVFFF